MGKKYIQTISKWLCRDCSASLIDLLKLKTFVFFVKDNLSRARRLRISTIQNTIATDSDLTQNTKRFKTQTDTQVSSFSSQHSNSSNHSSIRFPPNSNSRKRNFLRQVVPGVAAASCIGSIGYMYVSNPNLFSWDNVNHFIQPLYENANNLVKKLMTDFRS